MMIVKKISAFLLVFGLAFQAFAAPALKVNDAEPKLKENALKLLSSIARETGRLNVAENRIRAGTIVAGLLWEHDEQAARAISQNVFVELQDLFGKMNFPEGAELKHSERSKQFHERHKLSELRRGYVLMLAAHDPKAALAAFAALKTKTLEEDYDPLQSNEFELELATAIAKKDSEAAYALAKQKLETFGFEYPFVETLKELHAKNPGLAARLGKDVLAKIRNAKIKVPVTAEEAAANENAETDPAEISFWQIASFINAASEMNRRAARDKEKKTLPVLSETDMREAVDIIVRSYLNARNPVTHSIGQVMAEILQYAPAQVQRIRLKIGAKAARELDNTAESAAYHQIARKEKSIDELARDAERAEPVLRDNRYADVIGKALEENEPEKAQAITARIKDRKNYAYLFEQIEAALPLAKARRGDLAEVRKMLAALKTNQERIATLTELAAALAAKGERETAKKLADESLQMLPPTIKKEQDLESIVKIAAVYSVVAPDQAFTIIENGIAQMNEYINAGIALDDFFDLGSVEADELLFDSINRPLLLQVPNAIEVLKNLAVADFDRTVNLADKFARPEIRLHVRMRIAQALLDAQAAEKDKKMRERIVAEDEYH